jgi:hypothetical protein
MHLFRWQGLKPLPWVVYVSSSHIHTGWGSEWTAAGRSGDRLAVEPNRSKKWVGISSLIRQKKFLRSLLNIHLHARNGIRALHHGLWQWHQLWKLEVGEACVEHKLLTSVQQVQM